MADSAEQESTEDQSMEEILQSIRRIITEEEGDDEEVEVAEELEDDSDILELTEIIEEEVPEDLEAEQAPAEEPAAVEAVAEDENDILSNIDAALGSKAEDSFESIVAEEMSEPVTETDDTIDTPIESVEPAEPIVTEAIEVAAVEDDDSLLSDTVAVSAAAMFDKLKQEPAAEAVTTAASSLPDFQSGVTMEQLMIEMMRPMVKTWLDENLPRVVEEAVAREVRKVSGQ